MRKLKRPSPALVISVIALFVALGSVSYAALGRNSVKAKNIHKNAVTTKKIKNSAVTTAKIKNGAVTQAKLDADSRGQAVAWAQVNSDGTIDKARDIAASNISKPGGATSASFCFKGLPDFGTVLVSPTIAGDAHEFGFPAAAADQAPFATGEACDASQQITVVTYFLGLGTTASVYNAQAFSIALFK